MKKILVTIMLSLAAMSSFAEASFEQIEGLIQQKNYAAAASGLEVIVQNHPKSAKAFYAMAQAQAGLGNLEKANKALTIAQGLNPTLDFAPVESVAKLKQAITPQTAKIEAVEESHFWRDFVIGFVLFASVGGIIYVLYTRKKDQEEAERQAELDRVLREQNAKEAAARSATRAKESVATAPKTETPKNTASIATSGPAVPQPTYTPQPTHTTVVNNSSNDLLTGVLIGNMLGDHHHHDTTRVVEREVVREVEVPAKAPRSSWDDIGTSSSSRSSSWDDTPSTPSRSSSWDSDSSSSSSSSWSSSSSDSSSSWSDSSSSSSSSSWD